ncbi:hypothetical protein [Pelagibaculum spongiae]|uniref:Uncharacterized protein n=1 Tax=Pelagibaculum spongiae TaxID=2080658 RepID=A0A2V1H1F7_9GAMM|nr:hypothetical protein [Pelagibaculum spongiae]PVZ68400.1 hypothetical protein DC094_14070 [Pelagibaculum spongiae]
MPSFALFKESVEKFEGSALLDLSRFNWSLVLAKQMMLQQTAGACEHCMRIAEHLGFCLGISVVFITFYENPMSFKTLLLKDEVVAETIVRCQIQHQSRRGDHTSLLNSGDQSPTEKFLEEKSFFNEHTFNGTEKISDFISLIANFSKYTDCYFQIYFHGAIPGSGSHVVTAWNNSKNNTIIFFDSLYGIAEFSEKNRNKHFSIFIHCHLTQNIPMINIKRWNATIYKKTNNALLNISENIATAIPKKDSSITGKETSV